MGIDPVTAGLGAIGLYQQSQANNSARSSADRAARNQAALIDRQTQIFDTLMGITQDADRAGAFDPTQQLDQLAKDTQANQKIATGNIAGQARTLGYKPGDTVPLEQINKTNADYNLAYGKAANAIRRQSIFDKIGAYQGVSSAASGLNAGISANGQQQQLALAQDTGLGGIVSSIVPFLRSKTSGVMSNQAYPGMFSGDAMWSLPAMNNDPNAGKYVLSRNG